MPVARELLELVDLLVEDLVDRAEVAGRSLVGDVEQSRSASSTSWRGSPRRSATSASMLRATSSSRRSVASSLTILRVVTGVADRRHDRGELVHVGLAAGRLRARPRFSSSAQTVSGSTASGCLSLSARIAAKIAPVASRGRSRRAAAGPRPGRRRDRRSASSIAPSTDSSASRFCGGTARRCGRQAGRRPPQAGERHACGVDDHGLDRRRDAVGATSISTMCVPSSLIGSSSCTLRWSSRSAAGLLDRRPRSPSR